MLLLAWLRREHLEAARWWLTLGCWVAVSLVPLVTQAIQRTSGRTDRAQEEVLVVEAAGERLLETGSPYLARDAIAALPDRLLGYTPYQPGMALFGLPRAMAGTAWWTDARIWFALGTLAVLGVSWAVLTGRSGHPGPLPAQYPMNGLIRLTQATTVLPISALTLATGGDDLPVLALALLALALISAGLHTSAGLAIGAAGALKLFAWPITIVMIIFLWYRHRSTLGRFAAGALGLPIVVLLPALAVNAGALLENVVRFPAGDGLVTSPAQSPLPGYLITTTLPGGRTIALGLLVIAGLLVGAWLVRRPPVDAAGVALVCAIGLTTAIMLLPATRFGYLLYPIALAAFWWAIRSRRTDNRRTQVG